MSTTSLQFTAAEKAAEVRREIGLRRRVYPRMIASRQLDVKAAERHIAIMEQIAQDYEREAAKDAPQLFDAPGHA
jgi:hypothetical protein